MPSAISRPDAHAAEPAPQEIELKLALTPQNAAALLAHPLLAAHAPVKQTLTNAYFDTPDATLAAARIALRLRQVDGITLQTLKTAGHGGGGLSTRNEWEWEVTSVAGLDLAGLAELPPMRELGRDTLARLAVQLHTDFTRHRFEVSHRHSVIEVAIDQGEIVCGEAHARICELELELKAGAPEALWELADTFAETVALRPSDSSKAARGNALGNGHWPLADARTPDAWLHRATLALDAFHDSGQAGFLHAAQRALACLAEHPELPDNDQRLAQALVSGLDDHGHPTTAFGQAALTLSRRLARRAPLR
ncbi:MAG: CYTH domain-containing protein [Halomonas subglaciescola]|nr:CYTH domain-containing protein [Halomonas subglaciescola]